MTEARAAKKGTSGPSTAKFGMFELETQVFKKRKCVSARTDPSNAKPLSSTLSL